MGLSVMVFSFMPYLDRSRIPGGAHFRPWYRAMFYLFVADMMVLGYVGFVPPTDQSIMMGKTATVIYFALFALLPFMSKMEEKWLIKRGLPPEVEALIAGEAREKSKFPQRRRSGDIK
jgi:quinol-cytochrome oxidoreductase complex cytochrome b subunit